MGEAENKQLVQRAFDAWAAGEGGVFDLLEPDARWTIVGNSVVAGTYHSREEFLSTVSNRSTRACRRRWSRWSMRCTPTAIR